MNRIAQGLAAIASVVCTFSSLTAHAQGVDEFGGYGSKRGQQNYLDHFEEIRILQQYVADQAVHHGVPVVEASDFDRAVERCIDIVLDLLMLEQRRQLEAAENASQPS